MKKLWIFITALILSVLFSACGAPDSPQKSQTDNTLPSEIVGSDDKSKSENTENYSETETEAKTKLKIQIGGKTFTATLEDNAAVREFTEMLLDAPLSVEMSDYSGFEKVGSLGKSLTADDRQTTTHAGDIVLYNGNQIVMFYGSNSWSYTRLGHIDDLTGWADALGGGNITALFTIEK